MAVGRRLLHAIINTINKPEFYSSTMSFMGKRACSSRIAEFLHRTQGIMGVLVDNVNPMVSVMSLDKLFRSL
jgi:26S proteasome regulatory subunit T2